MLTTITNPSFCVCAAHDQCAQVQMQPQTHLMKHPEKLNSCKLKQLRNSAFRFQGVPPMAQPYMFVTWY